MRNRRLVACSVCARVVVGIPDHFGNGYFTLPHKGTVPGKGESTHRGYMCRPVDDDPLTETERERDRLRAELAAFKRCLRDTGLLGAVSALADELAAVRGEGAPTRKGGDGTAAPSSPSPPPTT